MIVDPCSLSNSCFLHATNEGHHGLQLHVHVQAGLCITVQKGLATATLAGHSVQAR